MTESGKELIFFVLEALVWILFGIFNPFHFWSIDLPSLNPWNGMFSIPFLDLTYALLYARSTLKDIRIRELRMSGINFKIGFFEGIRIILTISTLSLWLDFVARTEQDVISSSELGIHVNSQTEVAVEPVLQWLKYILGLLEKLGVNVCIDVQTVALSVDVVDEWATPSYICEYQGDDVKEVIGSQHVPLLHLGISKAHFSSRFANSSSGNSLEVSVEALVVSLPKVHEIDLHTTNSTDKSANFQYSGLSGSPSHKHLELLRELHPMLSIRGLRLSVLGLLADHFSKENALLSPPATECRLCIDAVLEQLRVFVDLDDSTEHHVAYAVRDTLAKLAMALDGPLLNRREHLFAALMTRLDAISKETARASFASIADYFKRTGAGTDARAALFEGWQFFDAPSIIAAPSDELCGLYPATFDCDVNVALDDLSVCLRRHGARTGIREVQEWLQVSETALRCSAHSGLLQATAKVSDIRQYGFAAGQEVAVDGKEPAASPVTTMQSCCIRTNVPTNQKVRFIDIIYTDRYSCIPYRMKRVQSGDSMQATKRFFDATLCGTVLPVHLQLNLDEMGQISLLAREVGKATSIMMGSSMESMLMQSQQAAMQREANTATASLPLTAHLWGMSDGNVTVDMHMGDVAIGISPYATPHNPLQDSVLEVVCGPFIVSTTGAFTSTERLGHVVDITALKVNHVSAHGNSKQIAQISKIEVFNHANRSDPEAPREPTARTGTVEQLVRMCLAHTSLETADARRILEQYFNPHDHSLARARSSICIDNIAITLQPSDMKLFSLMSEDVDPITLTKPKVPSWEPITILPVSILLNAAHTSIEVRSLNVELRLLDEGCKPEPPKLPFLEVPHSLTIVHAPEAGSAISCESFDLAGLLTSSSTRVFGNLEIMLHSYKFVPSSISNSALNLSAVSPDNDGMSVADADNATLATTVLEFERMSALRFGILSGSASESPATSTTDAGSAVCASYTSVQLPTQLFTGSAMSIGAFVGSICGYTTLTLPALELDLDAYNVRALNVFFALLDKPKLASVSPPIYRDTNILKEKIAPVPTSVFTVNVAALYLGFTDHLDRTGICGVSARQLEWSKICFGPSLTQTITALTALKGVDFTEPLAIHRNIFYSTDINNGFVNSLVMHRTDVEGEMPLMEIQIKHLRVFWLQRAALGMITFLKDHFLDTEMLAVPPPPYRHPSIVPPTIHPDTIIRGSFRMNVLLLHSELHLPTSAVGTDALVVTLNEAHIYFTDKKFNEMYMRGPQLAPTKIRLCELAQMRRCTQSLGSAITLASCSKVQSRSNRIQNDQPIVWWLPKLVMHATAPPEVCIKERDMSKSFNMQINILDASICSWCNRNMVGENLYLTVKVDLQPVPLLEQELFDELNTRCKGDPNLPQTHYPRSTSFIEVNSEHVIDWTLAQGQYMVIFGMLGGNFCEVAKGFKEYYDPDPLLSVHVTESLYGRCAMDTRCPMISDVPILLPQGRIRCTENKPEYYTLLGTQLPVRATPLVYQGAYTGFPAEEDTVPATSAHYLHRRKYFHLPHPQDLSPTSQSYRENRFMSNSFRDDEAELAGMNQEVSHVIYFQHLFLSFTRRHFGGGNGIDATARTFIICKDFTVEPGKDFQTFQYFSAVKGSASSSIGIKKTTGGSTRGHGLSVSGKNTFSAATGAFNGNDEGDLEFSEAASPRPSSSRSNYSAQIASEEFLYVINNIPMEAMLVSAKAATARSEDGYFKIPAVPQLTYSQESLANLRRCLVGINDSVVVVQLDAIMDIVAYWVEPVTVMDMRNLNLIAESNCGPFDFHGLLDIEVVLTQCTACLPLSALSNEHNYFSGAQGATAPGSEAVNREQALSGLCLQTDLITYKQCYRGFLNIGPGADELLLLLEVRKVFIDTFANMHLPKDSESLMEPFRLKLTVDVFLLSPTSIGSRSDKRRDQNGSNVTQNSALEVIHTGDDDHLLDKWIDFSGAFQKWSGQRKKYVREKDSKEIRQFSQPHRLRAIRVQLQRIEPETKSRSKTVNRRVSVKVARIEEFTNRTLHMRMSLRDVAYISKVLNHLTASLSVRAPRSTLEERYELLLRSSQDLVLQPTLQSCCVHVNIEGRDLHFTKGSDVEVNICDINVCLHNNTYNMHVLELDFTKFNAVYNHNMDNLHAAGGFCLSVLAHNEHFGAWEPVLEPVNVNVVVANDISVQSTNSAVQRVRANFFVEPMEFNANENTIIGLVRKLYLADSLTTSSVHLPPYLFINNMGVPLDFEIFYAGEVAVAASVPAGAEKPLEAKSLAHTKASVTGADWGGGGKLFQIADVEDEDGIDEVEFGVDGMAKSKENKSAESVHLVTFSCKLDGVIYKTVTPVPLDRDGFHVATLQPSQGGANLHHTIDLEEDEMADALSELQTTDGSASPALKARTAKPSKRSSIRATLRTFGLKNKTAKVHQPVTVAINSRIKDDGGREISFGSVLNFRNQTNKALELMVDNVFLRRQSVATVLPEREWTCPINLSYSSSALWVRQLGSQQWVQAFPTFSSLLLAGNWNAPTRLRSEVVSCPLIKPNADSPLGKSATGTSLDWLPWLLMLRPSISVVNKSGATAFVPVRMPSKLDPPIVDAIDNKRPSSHEANARNITVVLQAPMTLCNVTSQPLLYRIADIDGAVFGEGIILSGELTDIYHLPSIFIKRIYVSIRMVNYCWSPWTLLMGRGAAFHPNEKVSTVTLPSLHLQHNGDDVILPALQVQIAVKDGFINFYTSVVVSNRTSMQLDFCESSNKNMFIPHSSRVGADVYLSDAIFQSNSGLDEIEDMDMAKFRNQANDDDMLTPKDYSNAYMNSSDADASQGISPRQRTESGTRTRSRDRLEIEVNSASDHASARTPNSTSDAENGEFLTPTMANDYSPSSSARAVSVMDEESSTKTPFRAGTHSSLRRPLTDRVPESAGRISVKLKVIMPFNHLHSIHVPASTEMTLQDIFARISSALGVDRFHQNMTYYEFFAAYNGDFIIDAQDVSESELPAHYVGFSPVQEARAKSLLRHGPSSPGSAVKNIADTEGETSGNNSQDPQAEEDFDDASVIAGDEHMSLSGKSSSQRIRSISATQTKEFMRFETMPPGLQPGLVAASFAYHLPMKLTLASILQTYANASLLSDLARKKESSIQINVRLCHKAELSIFEQICKASAKEQEASTRMWSHNTGTNAQLQVSNFRFPLQKVEGDLPFHPTRMLGLLPSMSLRIPFQTGWSDNIPVLSENAFGNSGHSGVMHLNLVSETESGSSKVKGDAACFQFAAFTQRGYGLFEKVNVLTVVPKHLLVSKLNFAISVRQVGTFRTFQVTELAPKHAQPWHFTLAVDKNASKMIQIKRQDEVDWCGEIDINHLGCVYAKLRNPLVIVKVEVELVGGSLVGTFSEQPDWPPYQIVNSCNNAVRFRQTAAAPVDPKAILHKKAEVTQMYVPYDRLGCKEASSYAWDFPMSCAHVLEVEFKLGDHPRTGELWVPAKIALDDVTGKPVNVSLQKPISKPSKTIAEGWLLMNDPVRTGKQGWTPVYTLLTVDVLYVFVDEARLQLIDVINMSRVTGVRAGIEMARVVRYHNREWDVMTTLSGGRDPKLSDKTGVPSLDPNKTRIFLLKVADTLGLFDGIEIKNSRATAEDQVAERHSQESNEDRPETSAIKVQHADDLQEAIHFGATVDLLFDHLIDKRVSIDDMLTVFRRTGTSNTDEAAVQLFEAFVAQNLLQIHDGTDALKTRVYKLGTTNRNTEVSILPPVLHPELMEMARVAEEDYERMKESMSGKDSPSVTPTKATRAKEYGITIMLGELVNNFKCATEMEYIGWMQACRQSIEQSWIQYMRDGHQIYSQVTLEAFSLQVQCKIRVQGPTKILEIEELRVEPASERRASLKFDGEGRHYSITPTKMTVKLMAKAAAKLQRIRKWEYDVSVTFPSIGVSVIDADCVELFYFSIKDFDIAIEKTAESMQIAATMQQIQIANHIMPGAFHVCLFPRQYDTEKRAAATQRLMLPGLVQRSDSFPTLHFFCHKKKLDILGNPTAENAENKPKDTQKKKNLIMFDMLTVWIAPLMLYAEEEGIVRVVRMSHNISTLLAKVSTKDGANRSRKIKQRSDGSRAPQRAVKSADATNVLVEKQVYETDPGYATAIARGYHALSSLSRAPYSTYDPKSYDVTYYFTILQMHPIDITLGFRPTSMFKSASDELTWLGLVSQVDGTRVRLDALITEQASGTSAMFLGVIKKHYTFAVLTQLHHIIGQSDIVEGSLGLVANLGTGVYHLFYEPIEGLLDNSGNSSFLDGLSRGGKSLASRTIGGGAAQLSSITGGIGTGFSMLTMDSEYKDKRSMGKLKRTSTVGEGVLVGAKEFGSNIYDGVTGVLSQPIRGFAQGGIVGGAAGLGKGVIGLAVKPMVGVFDLASRTTEGIRNTAFGSEKESKGLSMAVATRIRLPRAFGRLDVLLPYAMKPAAAQYLANRLTGCPKDPPLRVVYHLHIVRRAVRQTNISTVLGLKAESFGREPCLEARGMTAGFHYIVLVCTDRIMLVQYTAQSSSNILGAHLVWTCPSSGIAQFYSDSSGDLIIAVNDFVHISDRWDDPKPAVLDKERGHNYLQMQIVLEKSIGAQLARLHPYVPPPTPYMQIAHKTYSYGVKSFFMRPKKATYHLYGCVLYEFTDKWAAPEDSSPQKANGQTGDDPAKSALVKKESAFDTDFDYNSTLNELFGCDEVPKDPYAGFKLSYVYPLVDLRVNGPTPEKLDGKTCYAITFMRKDGKTLRCMKKHKEAELLTEHFKATVTLIFETEAMATYWKMGIEASTIRQPSDVWNGEHAYVDDKQRKLIERSKAEIDIDELITSASANYSVMQAALGEGQGNMFKFDWQEHSAVGKLVIPASGLSSSDVERLKVEVGITLSNAKLV